MKNVTVIAVVVSVLVLGIGTGYALRGNLPMFMSSGDHQMDMGSMMDKNMDESFIREMIPHHEGAIEMARIALERSKRPEIQSLAKGIIEAQEKEINDMRGWYKSWYGTEPTDSHGGMGMMHMGSMEGDTAVLKTIAANEFDREFIRQMIPHHEMAIMMAQMLESSTERSEMKQLVNNIKTSQAVEIEQMRKWLGEWY